MSGLCDLGDEVTWEARHLGIRQRMSVRITAMEPHRFFQDRMVKGAFRFFEHDHFFETRDGETEMVDVLRFAAPFGPVGWVVERVVLAGYLRRFLVRRAGVLKGMAEGGRHG